MQQAEAEEVGAQTFLSDQEGMHWLPLQLWAALLQQDPQIHLEQVLSQPLPSVPVRTKPGCAILTAMF